jgi:catechol 2,3-dioxygenase-like lactoylglutathione lyase family enzyme
MSICKAIDVAHVRFRVTDLGAMRTFLCDFGLTEARSDEKRLFMRGSGPSPFIHASELAPSPSFGALGIAVPSLADLDALARHDGLRVEDLDAPGGGKCVKLIDPDNFVIEAIAGQEPAPPLSIPKHEAWNQGSAYPRVAKPRRTGRGPSHVMRFGHCVLGVSDFRRSEAWYKERFGLLTSDEIQPRPGVGIGAFMRFDKGPEPTDHHSLFILQRPGPPGFMHAAFEVLDLDDLMTGHDYLKARGYRHHWGIGRHFLGSQVFDYWLDPAGNEIEHWTDGDRLAAGDGSTIGTIAELMGVQWGMEMPPLPEAVQ